MAMGSRSHQCSICKKFFPRPSKLQYHIAYHHEKKFPFECTQCGKPYSSQDHVNRHYRTVHKPETIKTEKFICTIDNCMKTFANKQNLHRHERITHTKVKYKPVKCFYCLKLVDQIESHLVAEHQSITIEKLKCLDCSKEFSSIKRLIHHRIIHTDERREIDVQWTMNRLLEEIERREIYQCDLCDRRFRSLYQLDQHRNSQIHQTKFLCQYPNCKKTFLYMRNLRHHYRIHHEGTPRLSCPMRSCSKTFTCQASICRHLSRCHSNNDTPEQTNRKEKRSNRRQTSIQNFLTGFNSSKIHQDNEIAQQMKSLLERLLTKDNLIQISDENIQTDIDKQPFDSDLLKGYHDIGLVEL